MHLLYDTVIYQNNAYFTSQGTWIQGKQYTQNTQNTQKKSKNIVEAFDDGPDLKKDLPLYSKQLARKLMKLAVKYDINRIYQHEVYGSYEHFNTDQTNNKYCGQVPQTIPGLQGKIE